MSYVEILTNSALELKNLFKNDENFNTSLFALVRYLRFHKENFYYENEEHEETKLKTLAGEWLNSIMKLKEGNFSEENILSVLLATNELLDSDDNSKDFEEDLDNNDNDDDYLDDDDLDNYDYLDEYDENSDSYDKN